MNSSHGTRPETARKADLPARSKAEEARLAKALRANLSRRKAAPRPGGGAPAKE